MNNHIFFTYITLSTCLSRLCRWVIIILVLFTYLRMFITFSSLTESRAEVGSSRSKMGAFFSSALVREILCFSPPENMFPF